MAQTQARHFSCNRNGLRGRATQRSDQLTIVHGITPGAKLSFPLDRIRRRSQTSLA